MAYINVLGDSCFCLSGHMSGRSFFHEWPPAWLWFESDDTQGLAYKLRSSFHLWSSRLISLLSFGSKPCMPVSYECGHFSGRGGVQRLHGDWLHLLRMSDWICMCCLPLMCPVAVFSFLKNRRQRAMTQLNDREIWACTGQSKGPVRVVLPVLPSVSQSQQIF